MKKILFLTLIGIAAISMAIQNKTDYRKNANHKLIEEVLACSASLECPDGSLAKCTGSITCDSHATYVICDGNQTSYC